MRKLLMVTLTISVLTVAGCKHTPMSGSSTTTSLEDLATLRTNCRNIGAGNKNKKKPVVCISLFPGGASVNPVVIPASTLDGAGQRNKIRFISKAAAGTSDAFKIELQATRCVTETVVECPQGECSLDVLQTATVGTECGYTVVLSRLEDGMTVVIKLDPIVIIDTN